MTNNTNVKVWISEGTKDKLTKAFESNCESIAIHLTFTDLHGEYVIAITSLQLDRLMKAYEAEKGMTIKMSRTQMAYNMKIEGFLPMLAELISFLTGTVLPALGVGALSGLASTGVQKLIGNYLYPKKGGRVCQIATDGRGLYLGPTSGKGFETVASGLYFMKQGELYDGRELILGPNSPFKNPHSWHDFVRLLSEKQILYRLKNGNLWNWW